jgi:hypothetical protein
MAQKSQTKILFEGLSLAAVILLPVAAVIWFFVTQNGTTATAPAVPTPVAATQPAVIPASAKITLDNPNALPRTVFAGKIVPFSFTLENTGGAAAAYSYKVYVVWNSGERDVIDVNSVSLASGASKDILESLKFESVSASGQIYIQVIDPVESIHFALPRA